MTPRLPDTIEIQALGAQGDGIATVGDARIFVPFALPGDHVRCVLTGRRGDGWTAQLTEIVTPGAARTNAPSTSFGHCGGCMLQHFEHRAYRAWKLGLVESALHQRGLDMPEGAALIDTPPSSRRRARFAAERTKDGLNFGFHLPESTEIAPDAACPVLSPALAAALPVLRELSLAALGVGGSAVVTASITETGLDVLITLEKPLERRRALTEAAMKASRSGAEGLARLCWQRGKGEPEPLFQNLAPRLHFGGIAVDLPADSFLQPSAEGEAALVAAATAFAKGAKSIADLYSGCGTFTFPLAKIGKVQAVDSVKPAVAAIIAAANRSGLSGRVTARARNLDASPLPPEELKPFDCVVFDPPRAGAKSQAEMLVRSRIKHVVAISCNPASFARDARILIDGGFKMERLVAVDQFVWSAHVEVVALFKR
jgi:23S rRNA (uracil1939-C5)-methyltransferase